ncbi:unnamed protein product [Caenorhabditis bovis]|uniref:Uncharacterized protein n=1 Tax=Caenorhabditis bovis TaxID=2654633 RepID=A0A8S1FC90_9PELO|nr:unnamed protein product [Caenorhabditis bovis]
MFKIIALTTVFLVSFGLALRCYEGTVIGLNNNIQTEKKECGGISNYCIQRINKKNDQMRRECSSWSDEHSMEEKCPVSGCHFVTKDETFCCCQFDECNEWKGDGTEFKAGETVPFKKTPSAQPKSNIDLNNNNSKKPIGIVEVPTTPPPPAYRKNSEVELS